MKSRHHTKKGPGRMPFNKGNPAETIESFLRRARGWGKSELFGLMQAQLRRRAAAGTALPHQEVL